MTKKSDMTTTNAAFAKMKESGKAIEAIAIQLTIIRHLEEERINILHRKKLLQRMKTRRYLHGIDNTININEFQKTQFMKFKG